MAHVLRQWRLVAAPWCLRLFGMSNCTPLRDGDAVCTMRGKLREDGSFPKSCVVAGPCPCRLSSPKVPCFVRASSAHGWSISAVYRRPFIRPRAVLIEVQLFWFSTPPSSADLAPQSTAAYYALPFFFGKTDFNLRLRTQSH